jgi:hypothetical protein
LSTTKPLTLRDLLIQFLPLSLSDVVMVLAGPVIIAGLARLPDQTINLAAYSVALSMAVLIESPIIYLLQSSTALSKQEQAFRSLKRFMLLANAAVTAVYALIAFTPLFDLIFSGWLGQPPAVAANARPAFQIMIVWPAAIGWRRVYQGYLIARGQSNRVGLASLFRILSLTLTVVVGVALEVPGAVVAGLALAMSVVVEAAAVTFFALWPRRPERWSEPDPATPNTVGAIARWYAPLALTAFLLWFSKPAVNGGIARAELATLSLAAWPAVWTSMMLVGTTIRMVQQLVITQATSPENYLLLKRFTWWAGGLASGLLAVIGLTPFGHGLFEAVTGLQGELAAAALPALKLGFLFPLGIALQNHLQGLLIRTGRTRAVNVAALIGGLVLLGMMFLGVQLRWLGTIVGVAAVMVGQAAEITILHVLSSKEREALAMPEMLTAS